MTPIYVQYDKYERRITASLIIATYVAINDAEIGRHEQIVAAVEQDPELTDEQRAEQLKTLDDFPFQYESGDDEIYEDITGERPPAGMYAFLHEGDLFLGAHEDVADHLPDPGAREAAWESLKERLERNGFTPEWLHGSFEEA